MGLSASQARFLMLTGRQNDLEFLAQQISFQRTQIADLTADASKRYTDAINNTALFFRGADSKQYSLTYSTLTAPISGDPPGLGMFLTNNLGQKVVADESEIPEGDDPKKYIVNKELLNYDFFEKSLKEGIYFISYNDDEEKIVQKSISEISTVSESYDFSDDARAEAQYDLETSELQQKDKALELELDRLNSEHEAIKTEMESVQKVIDDNIEKTFNIFS